MFKRVVSSATGAALVCCFCGASTFGKSRSHLKEPLEKSPAPVEKKQADEKLKSDIAKLVADAKAGKLKLPAQQFPQPRRNNLSTGAKIAIVAGIGAAIFLIVMLVSLSDDDS